MNLKDEHQSVALTVQYLIKCQKQFPLLFMCMAKNIMAIQVLWEVTVTFDFWQPSDYKSVIVFVKFHQIVQRT